TPMLSSRGSDASDARTQHRQRGRNDRAHRVSLVTRLSPRPKPPYAGRGSTGAPYGTMRPNRNIRSWGETLMTSMLDDVCWIWPKGGSSTDFVASRYRLAVILFRFVQQCDRNVA